MKKQLFTYILFLLLIIFKSFGQTNTDTLTAVYKNENYKYEISYAKNWKFYEFRKDTINFVSRAEWQLPKKYTFQETNTILIEAYLKPNLEKVDDFYFEVYEKESHVGSKEINRCCSNGLEIHTGFRNSEKKTYYILKNGIGYVITLNCTIETYEKDLILFESFFSNIKFL
jgi:hypothetical protein